MSADEEEAMSVPNTTSPLNEWVEWLVKYNDVFPWRTENFRYSVQHALELYAAGCVSRALDRVDGAE